MKISRWQPALNIILALAFCGSVVWFASARPLDTFGMIDEQLKTRAQVHDAAEAARKLFEEPVRRFGVELQPSNVVCETNPSVSLGGAWCSEIARLNEPLSDTQIKSFIANARNLATVAEANGWKQDETNKVSHWNAHESDLEDWIKKGPADVSYQKQSDDVHCTIKVSIYYNNKKTIGLLSCSKSVDPTGLPRGSA